MNKLDFKHKIFSLSEDLYPMVFRLLKEKGKTEDAIQEIMIKLWHKRKQLKNHPNIKGFVFLTARNYCIDVIRKKNIATTNNETQLALIKTPKERQSIEWKELNEIIKEILKTFPEKQCEVFMMRDLDGYDFPEIATTLSISIEHTRVLLHRARKQIATALEKKYSYEKGNY